VPEAVLSASDGSYIKVKKYDSRDLKDSACT